MFGKLISKIFKETTNVADISPVTFNASGTYNPRYGKQKVYVTGKAQDGSYVPGNANYNTVPGNANYNTVPGTAYYNYISTSPYYNYSPGYTNSIPGNYNTPTTSFFITESRNVSYAGGPPSPPGSTGNMTYYFYAASIPSPYGWTNTLTNNTNYTLSITYSGSASTVPGTSNPPSPGNYVPPSYPYAGSNPAYYQYAGTNPTNYQYASTNPTVYPYAGANPDVATTGSGYSLLGVYFPGGYGTTAPSIGSTKVSVSYGSSIPVSVSGGYVTINFSL
jgi:hypothetical protein